MLSQNRPQSVDAAETNHMRLPEGHVRHPGRDDGQGPGASDAIHSAARLWQTTARADALACLVLVPVVQSRRFQWGVTAAVRAVGAAP